MPPAGTLPLPQLNQTGVRRHGSTSACAGVLERGLGGCFNKTVSQGLARVQAARLYYLSAFEGHQKIMSHCRGDCSFGEQWSARVAEHLFPLKREIFPTSTTFSGLLVDPTGCHPACSAVQASRNASLDR